VRTYLLMLTMFVLFLIAVLFGFCFNVRDRVCALEGAEHPHQWYDFQCK
jgi:hypothetical protein